MKDADIKAHILALFDEQQTKTRILRLAARGLFAARWWSLDDGGEVHPVTLQSLAAHTIADLRYQKHLCPLTFLKHPQGLVAPSCPVTLWDELRHEARDLILEDRADAMAITFEALLESIGDPPELLDLGEALTINDLLEIAGDLGGTIGSDSEAPTAYQLINEASPRR